MSSVFKIIKYVISGLFILLIVVLSIFILSRLFTKKSYTQVFGYSFFEVTSGSMYPEIEIGDLVIVKKRDSEDYQVGMTVTYMVVEGTTPVTHEIIKRDGDIITTKGIYNNTEDDPFDVKHIIGEVVTVYDGYGDFVKFIQNPLGLCIVIISCVIVFEIFDYLEKKTTKEKQ